MVPALIHLFRTIILLLAAVPLLADNGAVALAYPCGPLTIDGDLSDWPAAAREYPIADYHFGREPDGPGDLGASLRVAYDASGGYLYIGVAATDDDYVKTPDDNHYAGHDFQVLYLDVAHTDKPDGVVAFEVDEHHRKIVEQEAMVFYPQVAAAGWDDVAVAIERIGSTVYYEWRVKLPGPVSEHRVVGFDYAIYDKDEGREHTEVSWGPGAVKFRDDRRLGDLILLEANEEVTELTGRLSWVGSGEASWPDRVTATATPGGDGRFSAAVDSVGAYTLTLPAGSYRLTVPAHLEEENWFLIDRIEQRGTPPVIRVSSTGGMLPDLSVGKVTPPAMLPERGLLRDPFTESTGHRVDAFVEAYRAHYGIPAVSLALIQDGRMVYHRSYGVENTATEKPLRPDAVFEAASITKSVFAYAINRMVQRGDLDPDRPLYELLPNPDLEEDYPEYRKMTPRHVLTHVSGMPNWGMRLDTVPGTRYGYSGEAFEYLKMAVARDAGDAWPARTERLLATEVLDPLGMTNTYFSCAEEVARLKVAGHYAEVPMPYDCPERPGVAYSMHTEARDFAAFALEMLGRKGLSEEQAAEMLSFQTVADRDDWLNDHKTGFGLGVALRESPHGLVIGHGGNNGDFRCNFEVYDELDTGYVVFTNANTGGPLLFDLAQLLVEGRWDWPGDMR